MGIEFKFFEALAGDSILVSTERTNILIDGGYGVTYEEKIKPEVDKLESLDLVILTHIDEDHICGLIELVEYDKENREKIKELWFNSPKSIEVEETKDVNVSDAQAILFHDLLGTYKISTRNNICLINENSKQESLINNDIKLSLLSPTSYELSELRRKHPVDKEPKRCGKNKASWSANEKIDYRETPLSEIDISSIEFGKSGNVYNNSSIAFLLEYESKKYLFLADANIEIINKSLIALGYSQENRLLVEFVKLSHHGSRNNINSDFLDIVKTDTFITLTDGKSNQNKHPNKEIFRLILEHEKRDKHINFIFNYEDVGRKILTEEDEENYAITSGGEYTFNVCFERVFPFRRLKL